MQKVGILGSAVVGKTLAQGFKAHGYEVRIGSRSPAKLASFTKSSGVPRARWKRSRVGATSWSWRCRGLVRKRP